MARNLSFDFVSHHPIIFFLWRQTYNWQITCYVCAIIPKNLFFHIKSCCNFCFLYIHNIFLQVSLYIFLRRRIFVWDRLKSAWAGVLYCTHGIKWISCTKRKKKVSCRYKIRDDTIFRLMKIRFYGNFLQIYSFANFHLNPFLRIKSF